MSDAISRDHVRKTAQLGRILHTEAEVDSFTSQLAAILSYMEKLNEPDTDAVEPLAHVLPLKNVLRPDAPAPSLGSELAVREAPQHRDGFFKVPKVLGEGGGA